MNIIKRILHDKELLSRPPVLVDIGASGGYHRSWLPFAKSAVCLAFDADERKFGVVESDDTRFKKLYIFHSLVYHEEIEKIPFYLTSSPFCSSALEPAAEALKPWAFASKFDTVQKIQLPATTLSRALAEVNIDYIDWFKADTQGIDLNLFKSLPEKIREEILAVEVEPGIIDSYKGEDKLHEVLRYFDGTSFWLSEMTVKGFPRLSGEIQERLTANQKLRKVYAFSQKASPGWGEMFFLNTLREPPARRQLLLGSAIAIARGQYGFACELSGRGSRLYHDSIFDDIMTYSLRALKRNALRLRFMPAVFTKLNKLIFERY